MICTSTQEIKRAIKNGDITKGMVFSTPDGLYQIIDLYENLEIIGNNDVIGYYSEMEIDENGNAEPRDEQMKMTAHDLLKAEF